MCMATGTAPWSTASAPPAASCGWPIPVTTKLYAYNLPGGSRNSGKDITLHGDNGFPRGLHCDATHIWVADGDDKIFAYNHSTKARVTGQEFTTLGAAGNNSPKGIWSDGSTMWVVDDGGPEGLRLRPFEQAAGLRPWTCTGCVRPN